jgi:hypothetical protein
MALDQFCVAPELLEVERLFLGVSVTFGMGKAIKCDMKKRGIW